MRALLFCLIFIALIITKLSFGAHRIYNFSADSGKKVNLFGQKYAPIGILLNIGGRTDLLGPYSFQYSDMLSFVPKSVAQELQVKDAGYEWRMNAWNALDPEKQNIAPGRLYNDGPCISMNVILDPAIQSKIRKELRLGLTFSTLVTYLMTSEEKDFTQEGYDYSLSVYYRGVANNLFVEASQVYKTRSSRLFGLYGGYGLSTGIPVYSRLIRIEDGYRIKSNTAGLYRYTNFDEASYKAKKFISTQVFIPFGVNLKLTRKDNFIGKITFVAEGRFGYELITCLGPKNFTIPVNYILAGIRYDLSERG